MTVNLYCIGLTCYASSHDDFIGVFSSKERANKECARLNENYLEQTKQTTYPWDSPPYYVWAEDVTKFLGYSSCEDAEGLCKRFPEWLAIYQVPSLGEFILVPKSCTAVETYKIDEVSNDNR